MENTLNKKEKLWIKLMNIGAKMGCHQLEERSFSYKGYQFPLCARCTGVLLGNLCVPMFMLINNKYRIYIAIVFCIIMFLDWLIQYLKIKKSNNIRRLITGMMAGAGLLYIYIYIIMNFINIVKMCLV